MRVVILCGGKGTRMGALTAQRPKGLLQVGRAPIVEHIMAHYASYGHRDFVLLLGHAASRFREHFATSPRSDWSIAFSELGPEASKSSRLLAAHPLLGGAPFLLAYGDDLSDVDIDALLAFHTSAGAQVTLTAVHPPQRFGRLTLDPTGQVTRFRQDSPPSDWINAGFMVVEPTLFDWLGAGELEPVVLPRLAEAGKLAAYRHGGFWTSMNTPSEYHSLQQRWQRGEAPWQRDDGR